MVDVFFFVFLLYLALLQVSVTIMFSPDLDGSHSKAVNLTSSSWFGKHDRFSDLAELCTPTEALNFIHHLVYHPEV